MYVRFFMRFSTIQSNQIEISNDFENMEECLWICIEFKKFYHNNLLIDNVKYVCGILIKLPLYASIVPWIDIFMLLRTE